MLETEADNAGVVRNGWPERELQTGLGPVTAAPKRATR